MTRSIDADLATKVDDKDTAKCQLGMLKQASKLENTVLKEINKAKKEAIKEPTVDSASALAAELQKVFSSVFVPNEKIAKAEKKLKKAGRQEVQRR